MRSREERAFVRALQRRFPSLPGWVAAEVARTALQPGRVGRMPASELEDPLAAAVAAWVRHALTPYEELCERYRKEVPEYRERARREVAGEVRRIMREWERPPGDRAPLAQER